MVLEKASEWSLYYVVQNQSTPDTVPGAPSMIYIGTVTAGSVDPAANYAKVRGAGQVDYIKLHKLSEKPKTSVRVNISRIAYIKAVIDDVYHVLAFYNATRGQTVRYIGSKIDTLDLSVDSDDVLKGTLDIQARSVDSNAVSGASYGSATADVTDYTNVEISKAGTPITDWMSASMKVDNRLQRRIKSSDRSTRALERYERDNEWKYKLDVDSATALDEFASIKADTAFTFKFKVTDPSSDVWSCTFNNSKYTDLGQDVFDPSDLLGKELTGNGTTITYGTS